MTDETGETVREAYERLIKENPRFVEAPRTGQAIIGGVRLLILPQQQTTTKRHLLQLILREQAKHSTNVEGISGFQIDEATAVVGRREVSDQRFVAHRSSA
jgi:hypothetical protein